MSDNLPASLVLGVLLSLGFVVGLMAEKLKMPRLIGYILTGALFSSDLLGRFLTFSTDPWAPALTDISLGIIAYMVGAEINPDDIKKQQRMVVATVTGQSLGVLFVVTIGMWGLGRQLDVFSYLSLSHALIFGAIAAATAPATILAIIEEYQAKGKMTKTVLGIVAIDDAIGIVVFTLALGFGSSGSVGESFAFAGQEIAGGIVFGGIAGILMGAIGRRVSKEDLRLPIVIGFVLLVLGVSKVFEFSILLSCITLGFVSERLYPKARADWLVPMQHIEELVFLFFFTLAGLEFQFSVFATSLSVVSAYVLLRVVGKYSGAYAGLTLARADPQSRRLLGLCLFPQAGVAIGLAMRASHQPGLEDIATLLINVILGSTIFFELVSPIITKTALLKAGEIQV